MNMNMNMNSVSVRTEQDDNLREESIDRTSETVKVKAIASSGLSDTELSHLLPAIEELCCAGFDLSFDADGMVRHGHRAAVPESVPGATGRVLLLSFYYDGDDEEDGDISESLRPYISQILDDQVMDGILSQPILLGALVTTDRHHTSERPSLDFDTANVATNDVEYLKRIIEQDVRQYQLRKPIFQSHTHTSNKPHTQTQPQPQPQPQPTGIHIPTLHIEIDGAMIQNLYTSSSLPTNTHTTSIDHNQQHQHQHQQQQQEEIWDTSTIIVLDDLISDNLRQRLLDTVHGRTTDTTTARYDDTNGPDPTRWIRGGLEDTPSPSNEASSSWGLTEQATLDLCADDPPHGAVREVEAILSRLFSSSSSSSPPGDGGFVVSRFPEAVLGADVSPLTANAPMYGNEFAYHIDADPNLAPASPWTDVYGRYPNRTNGRPRFITCLIYLNPPTTWNYAPPSSGGYGAPTRFYDPPTSLTYDVCPKAGRIVIMDQDVTHTVVPPGKGAGGRPRYSLVWKLVLHPVVEGQDMRYWGGRSGGIGGVGGDGVEFVGSAKR